MKIEFSSYEEYFSKYLNIISAVKMPEDSFLTRRERDFLVASMICECRGMDINSDRGRKTIEEMTNITAKNAYKYRESLAEKGWLIKRGDEFLLPDILSSFRNKGIMKQINLRFSLIYEGDKRGVQEERSQIPNSE